jgi:hypothetical protein
MAEPTPQTRDNHTRFDPVYHYFLFPVTVVNVLMLSWYAFQSGCSFAAIWSVIAAIVLMLAVLKFRLYALKVQDRLIQLEERLRLATLLPEPLKGRIGELSIPQLIALRFAADAEVPRLVESALKDKLSNKEIKKQIVTWRPDYFRV